jgi:hypothetical protein
VTIVVVFKDKEKDKEISLSSLEQPKKTPHH